MYLTTPKSSSYHMGRQYAHRCLVAAEGSDDFADGVRDVLGYHFSWTRCLSFAVVLASAVHLLSSLAVY